MTAQHVEGESCGLRAREPTWGGITHSTRSCKDLSNIEAERAIGHLLQNDMQDEWIYKLWYLHTMKYYLAIKRHDTCYNVAWTSKLLC